MSLSQPPRAQQTGPSFAYKNQAARLRPILEVAHVPEPASAGTASDARRGGAGAGRAQRAPEVRHTGTAAFGDRGGACLFMFLLQDAASLELMMPFFSRMALFDLRSTQPGFTSGCDTYTLNLPE